MSGSTCVSLAPSSVAVAPPARAAEETHSDGMITIQSDEAPMILSKPRAVVQTLTCQRRPLGDGFAYRRSIGGPELESLDPILSFDDFEFTGPANFGDHPHRGFESLTYVLEGSIGFHDFSGHKGTINTGDAQWTTVGRGVVHAEVPAGQGVQRGLNFWINLAAKDKMVEPSYQELASVDIPTVEKDGVTVKVIVGEAQGVRSPLQTRTPVMSLDITVGPGAHLLQAVPAGWSACAYVIDGEASFGPSARATRQHECAVFGAKGYGVDARSGDADASTRFLLVAARPHGEKVVREGYFVMNTREELEQAMDDYRNHRNGFEMAVGWTSDHVAKPAQ
ncbi:pirin-like protein [Lolium rigidum]|uniref:pirin-like protein n=1 Tax=Lolium rigidum TaxID=89674 RepID=UPI001F5CDDAE|nr:pirin-like protein [Lolium rigidum]